MLLDFLGVVKVTGSPSCDELDGHRNVAPRLSNRSRHSGRSTSQNDVCVRRVPSLGLWLHHARADGLWLGCRGARRMRQVAHVPRAKAVKYNGRHFLDSMYVARVQRSEQRRLAGGRPCGPATTMLWTTINPELNGACQLDTYQARRGEAVVERDRPVVLDPRELASGACATSTACASNESRFISRVGFFSAPSSCVSCAARVHARAHAPTHTCARAPWAWDHACVRAFHGHGVCGCGEAHTTVSRVRHRPNPNLKPHTGRGAVHLPAWNSQVRRVTPVFLPVAMEPNCCISVPWPTLAVLPGLILSPDTFERPAGR